MPQVTLIDQDGQARRDTLQGLEAEDLLWAAGVDCGRWAPRLGAVSGVPQLAYARELLHLQERFASVRTQRLRVAAGQRWDETDHAHVHDDLEVRVVVQGVLRLSLGAMTLGHWLRVEVSACEWISVPAQLPHAAAPDLAHGVDLLCLHTRRGGGATQRTGFGPAPGLRQPPRVGIPPRPALRPRWQPSLAA
jgi:hypothetical protein